MADIRRIYGGHTADMRRIYGGYTPVRLADIRRTYAILMSRCHGRYMVEDLLLTPPLIGGPGKIVEVDESLAGKRKYNRRRLVKGKWLLGGVERGSNDCFLVECQNNHRDHHTLIRIIKQHVRPGTIII